MSIMRQWDYLFVALDRASMLSVNPDLKVRSVNDEEQEKWRLTDDVSPMWYCAERAEEGWELVSILDGLDIRSGSCFMSERHFTLMLIFKRPLE